MLKRRKSEHLSSKDALTIAVSCERCGELMHIAGYSERGICWKCTFNKTNQMEKKMDEMEKSEVSMVVNGKHRGRPKGSKNKPKFEMEGGEVVVKEKGKRGRPKGSKNKPKQQSESTNETKPQE